MKKLVIAGVAVVAVGLLCLKLGYWMRQIEDESDSRYSSDELQMTAESRIEAPIDFAHIDVLIEARNPTNAAAAKAQCDADVRSVKTEAESFGIKPADVHTYGVSIGEWSERDEDRKEKKLGYKAVRSLDVCLHNIVQLDDLLTRLSSLARVTIGSVTFGSDSKTRLLQSAVDEAVKTARKKAQATAAADGRLVGRAMEIKVESEVERWAPSSLGERGVLGEMPQLERNTFIAESMYLYARVEVTFALLPQKKAN